MSKIMPFLSFLFASVIVAFGLGIYIAEFKVPPYRDIAAGAKTLRYAVKSFNQPPYIGQFMRPDPDIAPDAVAGARFTAAAAADFPGTILVSGGLNEYLDICPGDGCIAVEIDRAGNVVHGYPYRPDAIFAADTTGGSFYREGQPADPRQIKRPLGLQALPGGDLLVSFQTTGVMFPYAGGIARIDRDGNPVWYRFDYAHHWVTLTDDGRVLVPDLTIATGNWDVPVGPGQRVIDAFCATGRPMVDGIQELDLDGNVVARYDIAAALAASPWEAIMVRPFDACDPLHINFVDVLDDTAPGGDLAPGNLVISARNLSAVLVYDPQADRITRVVKGSFQQQHSVHQLQGSRALMFDNWGAAGAGHGSRLLEIDLAGGPERQIFPDPDGPPRPEFYSERAGHLDVAPDRSRAMVSFSDKATGIEVDLATGAERFRYRSLHDLRGLAAATDAQKASAVNAKLFGIYYVSP